jgi:hypothetical protein
VRQRELDVGIMELLDTCTSSVTGLDTLDLDDLDTIGLGTMAGSHVSVGLSNGSGDSDITVLTVHVVVA